MQYACLVYIDPSLMGALTEKEGARLTDESIAFDWDIRERGHLIMAQPLQPPEKAVTVRVRNGKASHVDGPFAETKEFLGGFFLVEAADLNAAIRMVELSPMARMGSIEVRPFLEQAHSATGQTRPRFERDGG